MCSIGISVWEEMVFKTFSQMKFFFLSRRRDSGRRIKKDCCSKAGGEGGDGLNNINRQEGLCRLERKIFSERFEGSDDKIISEKEK